MDERRSQRIIAFIPLGIQPVVAAVEAETAVINLHGALIVTPTELPVGTVLRITNRLTNHEMGGRVIWRGPRNSAGQFKAGIEFDTAVTDFWGMSYDPKCQEAY